MPTDLYTDALAWSGQQSALLRRLAAGERVNDAIDWPNVIEEIADVGKSELRAIRSLLRNAIEHLLKIHAWPTGPVEHWSLEARAFLSHASADIAPSMRRRLGIPELYRRARLLVEAATLAGQPPRPAPAICPFTVNDLIVPADEPPSIDALLRKLAQPPA